MTEPSIIFEDDNLLEKEANAMATTEYGLTALYEAAQIENSPARVNMDISSVIIAI